jgi:dolichol-phosphate mannosyltransferase
MHTLVIVPTYNEAKNIGEVLRRARAASPDADILVVDDESPDGTADRADAAAAELGGVHVLRRKGRAGFGDAYRAGFTWGLERGARVLVQMDADLSHDPAMLPALVAGLSNHDLVVGSRYVPGGSVAQWTRRRRFLSRAGNMYARFMLGLGLHDVTSGFRAYRADLFRSIDLNKVRADGYGFQIEMAYLASQRGARMKEIPIRFLDRERGQSKMSGAIVTEAMKLVTKWGLARMLDKVRGVKQSSGFS